jgi:osmotically-inducible protein OsmY
MRKSGIFALALLAILAAAPGCTVMQGRQSTGAYLEDADITARVKAAYFNDAELNAFQVSVETMDRVVQLRGFVENQDAKSRAGAIASQVMGVRGVINDIVVR